MELKEEIRVSGQVYCNIVVRYMPMRMCVRGIMCEGPLCVSICARINACTQVNLFIDSCEYARMYACMRVCVCAFLYVRVCACVCLCV
jgi:hypothetical protein